ncbi:coniferyl aldehyde dehydrogenase [Ferrimonas pelagia]|uniref:Aldehyde dehydrogenase n=1 Tax=Ferrimonas pelagia TaxID=1177826 RepID=A0ABP9ENR1_9GAMM
MDQSPSPTVDHHPIDDDLQSLLESQRKAFQAHPYPTLEERQNKLERLHKGLITHKDALARALSEDFGHRSEFDSIMADILPSLNQLKYTKSKLKKWLKPTARHAGMMVAPAKVKVHYQPLGVVGIIVPWNFPVFMTLSPLITVLAAGNRAMIKLSEFTPATNGVLKTLLAEQFDDTEVAVIEGEAQRSAAFSALPFDHLFFTGSTTVGRHVMRAAADNLVPVTLELGGKSPVLIADDMGIDDAIKRIFFGKSLNAGQICVAPDYILLPEGKQDAFIDAYRRYFQTCYPAGLASQDYTSVINPRQYQRLIDTLAEATAAGAQAHPVCDHPRDDANHRLAPHLLTGVTDTMRIMQEEIFGPLLPVITYTDINDAIAQIQARPRPLALYLMSFNAELQQQVIQQTHAGGVAINETLMHVAADDAPFGGIGPSGMGHYHGFEGFQTFSKAKTVLTQGRFASGALAHPPYNRFIHKMMLKLLVR